MICPVCGFGGLREDARNHDICPSSGTEFGYDDVSRSHEALRIDWLQLGGQWFDESVPHPHGWNAWDQVASAFYPLQFSTASLTNTAIVWMYPMTEIDNASV